MFETRNLDKEKLKAHEKRLPIDGPENYNPLHDDEVRRTYTTCKFISYMHCSQLFQWNYRVERPGKLLIEFMRVPIPGTEVVMRCEECDCIDNLVNLCRNFITTDEVVFTHVPVETRPKAVY